MYWMATMYQLLFWILEVQWWANGLFLMQYVACGGYGEKEARTENTVNSLLLFE